MHAVPVVSDLTGLILAAGGLALAGALHCMGMCGGFAILARGTARAGMATYGAGKTVSYTVIGILAGTAGQVLTLSPATARGLAIAAGIIMIGMGLQLGGWLPFERILVPRVPSWLHSRLSASAQMAGTGPRTHRFGMGLLNGLLPCGLLYAAVALAATAGSWWAGGLTMLVFGLGTLPSLWVASQASRLFGPDRSRLLARLGAATVILFGVVTLFRGSDILHRMLMG